MSNTTLNLKTLPARSSAVKTKVISIAVFLFVATFGFAQTKTLGLYIGPNFSNVNITSPNLSAENLLGYQLGGYYRKGKVLYGQIGLEYMKMQTNLIGNDTSGAVDLNRFQLPLYGGLNLLNPVKKILDLRVYAGPVINFTTSATSLNPDFSLSDFSRFGVNGTVGAGVDVLIFSLDAGYTFALNNLFSQNFNGKADYAFVNLGLKF